MGVFGFAREDEFDTLIWEEARAQGVADPLLVKAIIAQESGFRPEAYRAEPQINDASRGLMQLLLGTARWLGFAGDPQALFEPRISIRYGTKYLAYQLHRYRSSNTQITDAIASYNSGTARRSVAGYTNQAYVDGVLRYYQGYQNAEAQAPPTGGVAVEEILRESPEVSGPASGDESGAAFWDNLWTTIWPAAPPPVAPAGAPAPDALSLSRASEEGDSFLLWAGLALLGIAGILAFARGR